MLQGIAQHFSDVSSYISTNIDLSYEEDGTPIKNEKIVDIGRFGFWVGTCYAVVLTVKAIVASVFLLLANALTLFLFEGLRNSLSENLYDIPKYIGAVVLGCLGVLFPETVQETVLDIPIKQDAMMSELFPDTSVDL